MKPAITERNGYWCIFSALASIAVIGGYLLNVYRLSLDIPYRDDFQDILIFVVDFRLADSLFDALSIILKQHADHLTLSSRIIYYLVFLAEGRVNFRTLSIVSHLGLLLLTWIYYLQFENKSGLKPILFLCLSLLLFNPRDYGIAVWPMAGFGFFFVYCYSLASLHFLNGPNNYKFFAAVLTAFLATFTMSMGQLIWLLGLIYLSSQRNYLQARFKTYMVVWIAFAIGSLTLFHLIYKPVFAESLMVVAVFKNPIFSFQAFLALLGAAVGFENILLSQILGAFSLILAALFLKQGFKSVFTPLHYFLVFTIVAIAIIVMARVFLTVVTKPEISVLAFEPRYSFASSMLWATLFTLFINNVSTLNFKRVCALVICCITFNGFIYLTFLSSLEDLYRVRIAHANEFGLGYSLEWPVAPTLKKAAAASIYSAPQLPIAPGIPPE
jgi:hypothetical protein